MRTELDGLAALLENHLSYEEKKLVVAPVSSSGVTA
jgi:hypothetical protein